MRKTGYDQFFKAAKSAKDGERPKAARPKERLKSFKLNEDDIEARLRSALKVKTRRRRRPFPAIEMMTFVFLGALTLAGFYNLDSIESFAQRIQVNFMDQASAAEKSSPTPAQTSAKPAAPAPVASSATAAPKATPVHEDLSYIDKLSARKKQLDQREKDLDQLEAELQRQKAEVDSRIQKLEQIRRDIASELKDRVDTDEKKVSQLVDLYSTMKPQQAAAVLQSLNENLAVQTLGKMKKKSAAAIMDVLPAEKAKDFSEKLTGYQR